MIGVSNITFRVPSGIIEHSKTGGHWDCWIGPEDTGPVELAPPTHEPGGNRGRRGACFMLNAVGE